MKKQMNLLLYSSSILILSVSFLYCLFTLTTHQSILSSRRIGDRLIGARITFLCCSLVVLIEKTPLSHRQLISTLTLLGLTSIIVIDQATVLNSIVVLGRGICCLGIFTHQKKRINNQRTRTGVRYAWSNLSYKTMCIAIITAIALISSLEKSNLDCYSFLTLGRLESMSSFIISSKIQPTIPSTNPSNYELITLGKEVFSVGTTALKDIFLLLNEQKDLIRDQTCLFINEQLEQLHTRPQRKFAGIFLLYLFLRPILFLLFGLSAFFQMLIRYILIYFGILKKKTYQDTIITFSL